MTEPGSNKRRPKAAYHAANISRSHPCTTARELRRLAQLYSDDIADALEMVAEEIEGGHYDECALNARAYDHYDEPDDRYAKPFCQYYDWDEDPRNAKTTDDA